VAKTIVDFVLGGISTGCGFDNQTKIFGMFVRQALSVTVAIRIRFAKIYGGRNEVWQFSIYLTRKTPLFC